MITIPLTYYWSLLLLAVLVASDRFGSALAEQQHCQEGLSSSFNNQQITFQRPNLPDRDYRLYTPKDYDPTMLNLKRYNTRRQATSDCIAQRFDK
eukprot:8820270-Ditylum_brightwellii.AAC.1